MIKILIGDIHKTGFYPPIMNYFLSVDESKIFNTKHELRHPGAIYNITSGYVIKSLSSLIDAYTDESLFELGDKEAFDAIFDKFRLVIYDLFKFYDSCYEILACFCDAPTKPIKFIDRWLKKDAKVLLAEIFDDKLKDDKSLIYLTYNKLKHTSNRIAWANIVSEEKRCIGYYLEAKTSTNVIGSTNEVEFPISLNRQIRNIYFFIYKISDTLCGVLNGYTKTIGVPFSFNAGVIDDDLWSDLFYKIEELQDYYLPTEISKEIYKPFLENESLYFSQGIVEATNSSVAFWMKESKLKLNFVTGGDSYSKSFSHPHMGFKIDV